jgi:hypothetical protein
LPWATADKIANSPSRTASAGTVILDDPYPPELELELEPPIAPEELPHCSNGSMQACVNTQHAPLPLTGQHWELSVHESPMDRQPPDEDGELLDDELEELLDDDELEELLDDDELEEALDDELEEILDDEPEEALDDAVDAEERVETEAGVDEPDVWERDVELVEDIDGPPVPAAPPRPSSRAEPPHAAKHAKLAVGTAKHDQRNVIRASRRCVLKLLADKCQEPPADAASSRSSQAPYRPTPIARSTMGGRHDATGQLGDPNGVCLGTTFAELVPQTPVWRNSSARRAATRSTAGTASTVRRPGRA